MVDRAEGQPETMPSDWREWQRWTENADWADWRSRLGKVERHKHLRPLLDAGSNVPGVVAACLRPPLHATRFGEGFGTLYTAEYRPAEGVAVYHWPGRAWQHSVERLGSRGVEVRLAAP